MNVNTQGLSAEAAMRHVSALTKLGPRHATTSAEHEAAAYIADEFRRLGNLRVEVEEVPGICEWYEHDARLRVVAPVERELTTRAILGCAPTPEEGVTAELIGGARGRPEDYSGKDLNGKFVIHDPPRARMLDNQVAPGQNQRDLGFVESEGVAGLIEYARLPGGIIQAPLLAPQAGLDMPCAAVTYEGGMLLKELLEEWYASPKGIVATEPLPVRLWMRMDVTKRLGTGHNVVAELPGTDLPDEHVLLLAHHDNAFGPGGVDNAASVAIVLETAKVLASQGPFRRTVKFVTVTAEEYGQVGSGAYVERHRAELPDLKACIVMDLVGNGDKLYYITESIYDGQLVENSKELNARVTAVTESLGYRIHPTVLEFASDDGPFVAAGVPTTYLCRCISNSWPWLHTYMDDDDAVDENDLKVVAEICAATIAEIANE
jgi:aminopeptidase YwaD